MTTTRAKASSCSFGWCWKSTSWYSPNLPSSRAHSAALAALREPAAYVFHPPGDVVERGQLGRARDRPGREHGGDELGPADPRPQPPGHGRHQVEQPRVGLVQVVTRCGEDRGWEAHGRAVRVRCQAAGPQRAIGPNMDFFRFADRSRFIPFFGQAKSVVRVGLNSHLGDDTGALRDLQTYLKLSRMTEMDITVDGEKVPADQVTLTLNGKSYPLSRLEDESVDKWEFGNIGTLTITKPGGLKPGEHQVERRKAHGEKAQVRRVERVLALG